MNDKYNESLVHNTSASSQSLSLTHYFKCVRLNSVMWQLYTRLMFWWHPVHISAVLLSLLTEVFVVFISIAM
jgi:hypothetical protein